VIVLTSNTSKFTNIEFDVPINVQNNQKHFDLHYCNDQADQIFDTNLSGSSPIEMEGSQCLMLNKRCLYQVSKIGESEYAGKLRNQDYEVTEENLNTL